MTDESWTWVDLPPAEFGDRVVSSRGTRFRGETVFVVVEEQAGDDPVKFYLGCYSPGPSGQIELNWLDTFADRQSAEQFAAESMTDVVAYESE